MDESWLGIYIRNEEAQPDEDDQAECESEDDRMKEEHDVTGLIN